MSTETRVQKHFDADSTRFDGIYAQDKSFLDRFIDTRLRGVVVERLRLTRALAPNGRDWSVLDVGCGSGRYDLALVQDGARRAVGLDFAPRMIELAQAEARRARLDDRCEFHVSEYLAFATDERFDLVLAMGYFDYVADPLPHLRRMLTQATGHVVASFPKRWEWRVPIRRLRFALARGYVRFYGRREVEELARAAGLAEGRAYVVDFGRDYLLIARP